MHFKIMQPLQAPNGQKNLLVSNALKVSLFRKSRRFDASLDSGVQGDFLGTMGQKSLCFQFQPGYMLWTSGFKNYNMRYIL